MQNFEDLKIAVAGTGYVGLSIATLLAQHHDVTAVDIIPEKIEKIGALICGIKQFQIVIIADIVGRTVALVYSSIKCKEIVFRHFRYF